MKRFVVISVIAAICVATVAIDANASKRQDVVYESSSSKVRLEARKSDMNFDKISVSSCVKLVVEDRTDGNIIVRANESIMPYVEISVSDNVLRVKLSDKLSVRLKDVICEGTFAEVYIPNNGRICDISVSGASTVNVKPRLKTDKLEVDCSGASTVNVCADVKDWEIVCSGASSCTADISSEKCSLNLAGATKLTLTGATDECEALIGGASKYKAAGFRCNKLKAKVAGCSSADVTATTASIEVVGCSSVDVYCDGDLKLEASGTSNITYSGNCSVSSIESSGMSSITKK